MCSWNRDKPAQPARTPSDERVAGMIAVEAMAPQTFQAPLDTLRRPVYAEAAEAIR